MVVNDLLGSCYWSIVRPAFGTASSQAHSGTWVAGRVLSRNELPENFRKTSRTNLLILTAPEELGPGVPGRSWALYTKRPEMHQHKVTQNKLFSVQSSDFEDF